METKQQKLCEDCTKLYIFFGAFNFYLLNNKTKPNKKNPQTNKKKVGKFVEIKKRQIKCPCNFQIFRFACFPHTFHKLCHGIY